MILSDRKCLLSFFSTKIGTEFFDNFYMELVDEEKITNDKI